MSNLKFFLEVGGEIYNGDHKCWEKFLKEKSN